MTYVTATELIELGDYKFKGQTRADKDGNYETEWLLSDGSTVRVKQSIHEEWIVDSNTGTWI